MERSEPSLVPEWLRSNGGGGLSHHFATSHSGRSSSSNCSRSSSLNGFASRHDKNPYLRSCSSTSSARNQCSKDFESDIAGSWDSESGPLTSFNGRRLEKGTLGRSKSMISGKDVEFSQRRSFSDLRNRSYNINSNGSGAICGSTGTKKVSFESDFPLLGYEGRPITPDTVRVPSPGLSKGVQGLSIGTSPLLGGEGWTSALAEVPAGAWVSDSVGSLHGQQQTSDAAGDSSTAATSTSSAGLSNGLNMAEALVQAPVRSHNVPQQSMQTQRFDELPFVGTKKLIPLTPLMPKTMVLNSSDKLKPKTTARSNDGLSGPKNGLQQMSPSLLRNGSSLTDGPKSSSGMLLLKPGREKGVSPALKDVPSSVAKGPSAGVPSITSAPFKNSNNVKHPGAERKRAAHNSKVAPVVNKRVSLAQLRSRNDFLNLIKKKSAVSTSSADNDSVDSSTIQCSGESVVANGAVSSTKDCEVNCNGDGCISSKNCSDERVSTLTHCEVIHPEEELEFLRALGWKDDAGDEEGLTEEEIDAFVRKYMTSKAAAKLLRGLELNKTAGSDSQRPCTAGSSPELSTPPEIGTSNT